MSDTQNKASTQKIDEILGRALRDRQFRVKLVNDPAGAAKDVGLSAQEMQLIAGGLAIGNSLLNPGSIMYCTAKTCNEKGGARVGNPIDVVGNPAIAAVNAKTGG